MANIDKRSWKECKAITDDPSSSDAEKAVAQKRMDEIKKWLDSQKEQPKTEPTKTTDSKTLPVRWPETPEGWIGVVTQLVDGNRVITSAAVQACLEDHPGIDINGNLFGQMVSATKGHMLLLRQIEATKELTKALTK